MTNRFVMPSKEWMDEYKKMRAEAIEELKRKKAGEMTEQTAFEKWWGAMQEIYGKKHWPDEESVDKAVGRIAWNAAIDAAISKCVPSDNFGMHATDLDVCRAEIQKLRSE